MEDLAGINIGKPVIDVSHAELERSDNNSLYRSVCPACDKGVLLMKRNLQTLQLEEYDNCVLCGQSVHYNDLVDLDLV